ncbi:methyltransferase domain-containing protein [Thermoanaerobacterium thermosaccharolyticum]|uniref:methyltransferase domain-containing protein n=1 Tax=Thermoanaerobacterium thermosaccharolyticum TaxID=1517 RepID=UPI001780B0D7|nr:class I SAM-dependent methyltransferase [Thermoanaerobacterium thermosaccharolyticum]MBE0069255.1 methyltransferase domain-containing protein [Thermoanaerobacterium thermosaccharolyticum]MBE0229041.1 methyltransferase domain-containing protein [Thermoanaerobacterium thermosaccharolyticum]
MEDSVIDSIKKDIEEILKAKRELGFKGEEFFNMVQSTNNLMEEIKLELNQATYQSQVDINQIPVTSHRRFIGKLITFFKRAIRKSTFWLYEPLFLKISSFNSIVVSIINKNVLQVTTLKEDMEKNFSSLEEAILKFEKKLNEIASIDIAKDDLNFEVDDLKKQLNEYIMEVKSNKENIESLNKYKVDFYNKINNLKKQIEEYRAESTLLRAKLAVALQYVNTGKLPRKVSEFGIIETNTFAKELTDIDLFYNLFEQQFRGSEEMIKKRQAIYISDIQKAYSNCGGFVLDFGCGRGEFLELCREAGIPAKGVDLNDSMAKRSLDKGLDVEIIDGFNYLSSLPDESLCAFTAFQVVEHLTQQQLWQLVQTALVKLKSGGVIILETVNVDSLFSLKNFYLDLTHKKPIPPQTLHFLLEIVGFKNVDIVFSSSVPDEMKLIGNDENVNKLNSLLFGAQDYAVKGWR